MKAVLSKSNDFKFSAYRKIHYKFILITHKPTTDKSWNYASKHLSTIEQGMFERERDREQDLKEKKYLYSIWSFKIKKLQGKKVTQITLTPAHQVPIFVLFSTE